MANLFLGEKHAEIYARHRRDTAPIIVDKIISYLGQGLKHPYGNAVDVGCGAGQSTRILSPHFRSVTGIDNSPTQVSQALLSPNNPRNVSFLTAPAEQLPYVANSIQLLTASSCLHWFKHQEFFTEANRVLTDGGVLAIYSYRYPVIIGKNEDYTKKTEEIVWKFLREDLKRYRDQRIQTTPDFSTMKFPFRDAVIEEGIRVEDKSNLEDFLEMLSTFTTYQALIKQEGLEVATNHIHRLRRDLKECIDSTGENPTIELIYDYRLIVGRK